MNCIARLPVSALLVSGLFALAAGCAAHGDDAATGHTSQALWNDPFVVKGADDSLAFSGQDLQASSLAEVDESATSAGDGSLVWHKSPLTGDVFTVCAPSFMPGVDRSTLSDNYAAGVLGAKLSMNVGLDPAVTVTPDTPIFSLETGHYTYDDLGNVSWQSDTLGRTWTAKEITSGAVTDYTFDRGAAWALAHHLPGGNCGFAPCASQDLSIGPFADDKTCARIALSPPAAGGSAPVASFALKGVSLDYRAWTFAPNFPRQVTLGYTCDSTQCYMPPELVATADTEPADYPFHYVFRPVSAQTSDIPGVGTDARAWFSLDQKVTLSLVNLDDPSVYDARHPLSGDSTSGLWLGAYTRSPRDGEKTFVFEVTSVEPSNELLADWHRSAMDYANELTSAIEDFTTIRNLASLVELQARQQHLTLGAVEALLVYDAHSPDAKIADLYYATGPDAGKSKAAADLPAWFTAAGQDATNLNFRRLAQIRAQLVAGQAVTEMDENAASQTAADAIAKKQADLQQTLDKGQDLLARLVRWTAALKQDLRALRDDLLKKTREGQRAVTPT